MTDNTELAQREYDVKGYSLAVQFAQYALARDPDDAAAMTTLGRSLLKLGDVSSGVDALERSALIRPLCLDARIELAIGYGTLQRTSLSRDLLMAVAVSDDVDTAALLKIAAGLEAIDEPRLAMEACRQAGRRSPETAEVHFQMGHYAGACGHPVSVSEALVRHAIDLDPDNLHYQIGLSSLLIRVERYREAVSILDAVVPERLDEVTCECCLRRIANLFFDVDDVPRAKLCAARLSDLQVRPAVTSGSPRKETASS
ncbi:MAG: hypothetical protein AAGJ40_22750 [Planctomycetota bacterium]